MYEVETIQIDEDNRVVVYYDDYKEDPRDWGWDVQMFELHREANLFGNSVWQAENPDNLGIVEAFNHLHRTFGNTWPTIKRGLEVYQAITEDTSGFDVKTIHVGRDRLVYLVLFPADQVEQAEGFIDTMRKYFNGEVYVLEYQVRKWWSLVSDNEHEEMYTWEEVDNVGGFYFSSDYTALDAALEHFYLPAIDS